MLTVSANLNELGNPTIWGANYSTQYTNNDPVQIDLYKSKIIVEKFTTGIEILITPVSTTVVDKAITDAYNTNSSLYADLLAATGLTASFNTALNGFLLTGDILSNQANTNDDLVVQLNSFANFVLFDASNQYIENQELDIVINDATFVVSQKPCTECIILAYLDSPADYVNPLDNYGLADKGVVEYQYQDTISGSWISMGSAKIEGVSWSLKDASPNSRTPAKISYCHCGLFDDTPLRAIRTIRTIPNCGGTSPIIYQSISNHFRINNMFLSDFTELLNQTLYTSVPYEPSIQFDANFNTSDLKVVCCVSEDSEIEVTPLTLTPNRNSPHNTGIANALKYDLYINNEGVYDEVVITEQKTGGLQWIGGTNTITSYSPVSNPYATLFLTELTIGSKLYTNTGVYIGTVKTIVSNTALTVEEEMLDTDVSNYCYSNKNYFINPTTGSVFTYTDIIKGTYKLIATYNNACTSVSKEWIISICNASIINTGTCNNPSIQNLSAINYAKFTIKTSNSLDIIDSVSQKVILKDQIVAPLSTYQVPKLDDGFYQLDVETLDEDGVVLNTESQLLFYDCNIKSCEVYLRSNLLGFSNCVDCVDKKANQKEYETLKLKNDMFQIYKDIIYSYWNNIKKQQSIDETWDIEDHLQEVTTYSNALKQIKTICTDCGFSFNTNTGTLSSGDCGCNG